MTEEPKKPAPKPKPAPKRQDPSCAVCIYFTVDNQMMRSGLCNRYPEQVRRQIGWCGEFKAGSI